MPNPLPVRDIFVEANGLRHHLVARGTPGSPVVMMIHGLAGQAHAFDGIANHLAASFHVYCLDVRGRGESAWGPANGYGIDTYVADLEALIDAYAPDGSVDLCGHSLGGNAVCIYSGIRPARVAKLINLEGLGLRRYTPDEAPGRYANWLDQLRDTPAFRSYPDRSAFATRLQKENPRLSDDKARFLAISEEQSALMAKFEENVLDATND